MSDPLVQIIAKNVRAAYEVSGFKSFRALSERAGVAPNSVKNLIEPKERAPSKRGDVSPRLDILAKVATALGYEIWQLTATDFDPSNPPTRVLKKSEADFYKKIEDAYRGLPPDPLNGSER